MFESNEAVRDRLIGPKPWDLIDLIFFYQKCEQPCMGTGCLEFSWCNLCFRCLLGMRWAGLWPWIAGSQSEPLSCDFSGIVTEGFTIPETVF